VPKDLELILNYIQEANYHFEGVTIPLDLQKTFFYKYQKDPLLPLKELIELKQRGFFVKLSLQLMLIICIGNPRLHTRYLTKVGHPEILLDHSPVNFFGKTRLNLCVC
jgi:hypothetical protein